MTEEYSEIVEIKKLEPRAIFGIAGSVQNGLRLHPDKIHMIYPLGNKIAIAHSHSHRQEFLSGHTNAVSCLDVSASGKYMASGQVNHMGFQAYVILWSYDERKELARHDLHKVLVQSLCFTAGDKYVVSVGGIDDGTVIVFDIETYTPICRSVAARNISGKALAVTALHNSPNHFIVGGERHLRMWSIQREQKKLHVHDISVGKNQRVFTGIRVDPKDQYVYLGTMTGDVMKIVINCCDVVNVTKPGVISALLGAFGKHNTRKPYGKDCDRWVNGVRHVHIVEEGLLLIGAGDGTLELVEERKEVNVVQYKDYPSPTWPMLRVLKKTFVNGSITSFVTINALEYLIATNRNEIYSLNLKTFGCKLLKTCHRETVYDIVYPHKLSLVFATASYETIRIWSTKRLQELLRIMVFNFRCAALKFTFDGSSILSAWNDGIVRSFTPMTGRLIFAIPNAHNKGCSALTISSNGRILVTGGIEGQVRIWKIEPYRQSLLGVLKDHSGPISSLDFNHLDTEVISACTDGSCVIWDVGRMTRKQVITANTQFMNARYFPTGVHLLTCGSDGGISYWMVYNGSLIRELEGSKKSSVNSVAISRDGEYFVSVGSDQMVKLWDYNRGIVICEGTDHASSVVSAAYSPCGTSLVTGSTDGSIIIWNIPEEFWAKETSSVLPKSLSKTGNSQPKLPSARSSGSAKKETVDDLVAKSSKADSCCVECPPIDKKKLPDINEKCNYIPDVRKC